MNFRRLTNPEVIEPTEVGGAERVARKVGGYTLGLLGYGVGVAAFGGIGATGGLSLPVLGGISGALFAGSRALLRPAYQDADDYEPVQSEEFTDKAKRIGAFVGGIALFNIGGNLLFGGLFNALEGISMNAPVRAVSSVAGLITATYGARFVRGSYDPDLHHARSNDDTPRTLSQTAKLSFLDGWRQSKTDRTAMREFYARQSARQRLLGEEYKQKMMDIFQEYSTKLLTGEVPREAHKSAMDAALADYKQRSEAILRERYVLPTTI